VLSTSGAEEGISCIAVERAYSDRDMPPALTERDLEPLSQARGLWHVVDQHQEARAYPPSVQHLTWMVR
jgi:hypothetical protein